MAGEFLRSHGIDINAEMSRIQFAGSSSKSPTTTIENVSLPGTEPGSTWTVHIQDGVVKAVEEHKAERTSASHVVNGGKALLTPSLCHPHIHLDKAYLISHPRYAHLQIERGDFQEAMDLTARAKAEFEHEDLLERGQRVIGESVAAGVTHMRAFVEVDAGVGMKCLDAGVALKKAEEGRCHVQLCAFAQLALFSASKGDEDGGVIRELMRRAAGEGMIDVVGSTPYVEANREKMERNVEWMVDLSIEFGLHLDFHLDYNLDSEIEPLIWHVLRTLKSRSWKERTKNKTVVLGHCTRLTLWSNEEWEKLADEIRAADLPISFVGLPTSDLFMMRTGKQPEIRGTLDVPRLINNYGLNACIGVNNIGNAFTPQGSCDPLSLACQGVGIYQAGTKRDTEVLFECVSTRAKAAIGFRRKERKDVSQEVQPGDEADFVLFAGGKVPNDWRTSRSVSEAVYLYDHCQGRRMFSAGTMANP